MDQSRRTAKKGAEALRYGGIAVTEPEIKSCTNAREEVKYSRSR